MIKNLTAVGNSLGLIIDKPILELLNIDKETPLEVRTDGEGLIIRPVRREASRPPTAARSLSAPPQDKLGEPKTSRAGPPAAEFPEAKPQEAEPQEAEPQEAKPQEAEPQGAEPQEAEPQEAPPVKPPPDKPHTVAGAEAKPRSVSAPEVVVELRGEEVMRVPLREMALVLGREASADIHLDDRALSRKHARIERRGAAIWVLDLDSANGTFVNGERIQAPRPLHGGDVIGVGHYRVRLEGVTEAKSDTPVLTLSGPEGTHRFAMVGEQIIIGRSQSCDISIGHKSISRRHVRIAVQGEGFLVEDLGSQNPAKLNGKPLEEPTPFARGDKLEICDFTLELGYLEDGTPGDGAPREDENRPRTMLIDRSVVAQAAYVDGDFDHLHARQPSQGEGGAKRAETGEYRVDGEPARRRGDGRILRPKKKVR